MKSNSRRLSTAALVFLFTLSVTPISTARPGRDFDFGERFGRMIKKVQKIFRIGGHEDFPTPPKP